MKWKRFYPNIAHATERNERLQKILINPTLVALMVDGLRNAAANGYDLSNMSDLDIGTEIARGIREFEHVTQDELARAVRDARRMLGNLILSPTDPMQEMQRDVAAVAQQGWGTKFTVQPLSQPRQRCRERFLVHHSYSNGVPISQTGVAITFGGQVRAFHPKFRWDDADKRGELDSRAELLRLKRLRAEREDKPYEEMPADAASGEMRNRLAELIDEILDADTSCFA
jgi:hypothetical protein